MPTYRIQTLGCKLNQADSAALESRLRGLGMRRSPQDAAADLVVLNTCTVTAGADREARQIARRLRGANPAALLIVTGCYAERDPEGLRSAAGIDHVVPLREQEERIPALAAEALGLDAGDADGADAALGPLGTTDACDPEFGPLDRTRALLKVQDGCNLRCSYCIIPAVRGSSRSLAPAAVLERLAALVAAGFREIVLTGVNTGDYGRDLDPPRTLRDLLQGALTTPGLGRLRLNSLEPRTVTPELVEVLADSGGRLAPHVQIPLQSGCDDVLARMRRPYRTDFYAGVVARLRRRVPGVAVGADVIVGFPGETDAEFETTCRFVETLPLDYLHVFSYSPRPTTVAAASPDPVAPQVVKERSRRLRLVGRRLSLRYRASCVGQVRTALALRGPATGGDLRALTDNFIEVRCAAPRAAAAGLVNRLLPVRLTGATDTDTFAALEGR